MAIHASPGVYWEIEDYSTYASELTTTTLALVGKTVKGPTVPTFISSVRQFTETFGYPRKTDYSALAAISFLEYGNALWFRRLIGAEAKKAGKGIPAANPIYKEGNIVSVDNDQGFVLSNSGNELGGILPGTLCIEIKRENSNVSYIRDNAEGGFNSNTYSFLSDTVNYVNYSTGDFRFTLKNNKVDVNDETEQPEGYSINNNLYVKYIVNSYDKDAPDGVQKETGATFTGTLNTTGFNQSIKSSSFVLKVLSENITYVINCKNEENISENGTGSVANLYCVNSDTVESSKFKKGTLDLTTGQWSIEFNSNLTTPYISIEDYVVEQYKYKRLGRNRHYTDTINLPLYKNGFYLYDIKDVAYDVAYTTEEDLFAAFAKKSSDFVVNKIYYALDNNKSYIVKIESETKTLIETENTYVDINTLIANNYIAIAKDNGSNNIVGTAITKVTNKVDYTTGKISLICTEEPEDRTFDVNVTALYTDVVAKSKIGKNSYTYSFESAIIPGSISILVDKEVVYVDKINENNPTTGDLILDDDDNSEVKGRVIYHQKIKGVLKGSIEFEYTSTSSEKTIEVSYLKEIGYVESRNYGESDNDLNIEFFAEDFKDSTVGYYGMNLWNSETSINTTPTETFRKFTFGDTELASNFVNKVTSTYVTFDIYDDTAIPVLNYPIDLSGGYSDANDITESSAVAALDDFNNPETYDINLIAVPDYPGDKSITAALFELCENTRGDCFCVVDPPYGLSPQNVVAWHNGDGIYANQNALTSKHGALYYPWIKISNEFTETLQFVPPSVKVLSVYAYSDNNAAVWYAPAGLNRGKIFAAVAVERQLTLAERDLLYATDTNAVNPICDFPSDGIAIWGQKTLQREPSALDRVNVMRMILYVTKVLATATKYLLFDPHDETTWEQYVMLVEPFLENIKTKRGLTDYLVKCDSTTNTTSDIDNNTMVAEVSLKPTKSIERIITRFKITSSGASLSDITSSSN